MFAVSVSHKAPRGIIAHMLRHTCVTMLFDANAAVKSARRFLGHAGMEMTLAVHIHLSKDKENNAAYCLKNKEAINASKVNAGKVGDRTSFSIHQVIQYLYSFRREKVLLLSG